MPVANVEVDSRVVWRAVNRPDGGTLVAERWIDVSPVSTRISRAVGCVWHGPSARCGEHEAGRARGSQPAFLTVPVITGIPREVGVMLKVRADDQDTATAIAQTANVLLLHMPLPGMNHLPSFAFVTSPAEIERGPAYEFVLNHVVEVADGTELVRTSMSEVSGA